MTRFAAFLLLAACSTGAAAPSQAPRTGAQFAPDSTGLAVVGSSLRVDFGRSPAGVIPLVERELGPGRALDVADCPAGVTHQIAWGDLVLTFTGERFVGWRNAGASAGQTCGRMA